jgi:hypothetical protein
VLPRIRITVVTKWSIIGVASCDESVMDSQKMNGLEFEIQKDIQCASKKR